MCCFENWGFCSHVAHSFLTNICLIIIILKVIVWIVTIIIIQYIVRSIYGSCIRHKTDSIGTNRSSKRSGYVYLLEYLHHKYVWVLIHIFYCYQLPKFKFGRGFHHILSATQNFIVKTLQQQNGSQQKRKSDQRVGHSKSTSEWIGYLASNCTTAFKTRYSTIIMRYLFLKYNVGSSS
jgi:hypothetical protein